MQRFLVFTTLFPPLALLVGMAPQITRDPGFPEIGFVFVLLQFAYLLTVLPAWIAAAADWGLSAQPLYLRLIATMSVAPILIWFTAQLLGLREGALILIAAGALPAAVCSSLSTLLRLRATA